MDKPEKHLRSCTICDDSFMGADSDETHVPEQRSRM